MTMYVLLGVQESATEHQIRAAYRTLARRYHPDVSRTPDAKKFARIQQAYNVVGSTINRLEYDEWLRESRQAEKKALARITQPTPSQNRDTEDSRLPASRASTSLHVSAMQAGNSGRKGSRIRDWFTGPDPEPTTIVWG